MHLPDAEKMLRCLSRAWHVVIGSALLCVSTAAVSSEVWVVTDQRYVITAPTTVRVIRLDAPAEILTELTGKLPADSPKAAVLIRQRLAAAGPDLHRRLVCAYQDVLDARRVGVRKIPAVVVDQRYVVYGEVDVKRALEDINRYQKGRL